MTKIQNSGIPQVFNAIRMYNIKNTFMGGAGISSPLL